MLASAAEFFALPIESKQAIAIEKSGCHRGYVGINAETLDSGGEHGPDHPEVRAKVPLFGPNQLPDLRGFRQTWDRYRLQAIEAAEHVQRAMARALGLADDGVGGLQVMRRDSTWIDVTAPAGTMVVNLGDLMAVWTNDRWVSNPHRVLNPPDTDRSSMPLFVTPPFHAVISCLPSCLEPGETARYQPQQSGPYLLSRFDATHSYRNPLLAQHIAAHGT